MNLVLDTPALVAALIVAAAVIAGMVRTGLRRRATPPPGRGPRWRLAALMVLQVSAGVLLWLTLNPPRAAGGHRDMTVATQGAPAVIPTAPGEILVAVPEAGSVVGATRVPDLATALRRHPDVRRLHVVGDGLPPRDQEPVDIPVRFTPPPLPLGVIELVPPQATAPGAAFQVGGRVGRLQKGVIELIDPGGEVVDQTPAGAGERFALSGRARAAGPALFTLRLRNANGQIMEQAAVPVDVRDATPLRVLALAGAPNPDLRFLRRWAEDAGMTLSLDIDLGAGARLGDGGTLSRSSLNRADLMVIDDRRWAALDGAGRATLTAAVRDGLGLLLRPTGPLSAATRREWAELGLALTDDDDARPWSPIVTASSVSSPDEQDDTTETAEVLSRFGIVRVTAQTVSLIQDAEGRALAAWAPLGRGRVGIWTVADSYALALTGHADRHGEIWSDLFAALARPGEAAPPRLVGLARVGERATLCGLPAQGAVATDPEGARHGLRVDPRAGGRSCAAYWPMRSGWHWVQDGTSAETPLYVRPADDAPSLARMARRQGTLEMTRTPARLNPADTATSPPPSRPGSAWPWFIALLTALALLWGLERKGRGRPPGDRQPPTA